MPIWVRGEITSDTFVVFLHGGPGGSGIDKIYAPGFQPLAEKYAMVFFDQRNSGTSQGNSGVENINLAHLVEDTTLIIDLIREKYRPRRLFLMGHSWGGTLGTAYLLENDNESKIDGWIDIAGVHDYWRRYEIRRDIVLEYAEREIDEGIDVSYRIDAQKWLQAHASMASSQDRNADENQIKKYITRIRTNPYWYDQSKSFSPPLGMIGASPLSGMADLYNMLHMAEHYHFRFDIHLSEEMHRLTLPSLMLFGRHDYVYPPQLGQDALDSLGTPPEDKSMVVFDRSGHFIMYEEGDRFADAVITFIQQTENRTSKATDLRFSGLFLSFAQGDNGT